MEELRQVRWCLVIEGFVCYEEDFEVDFLGDGEPVKLMENGGEVAKQQSSGLLLEYK